MMPTLRPAPGAIYKRAPTSAADLACALGAKKSGKGWIGKCPAHKDNDPSFSIGEGDNGKVLIHCFAGCDPSAVIDALKARGLWNGEALQPFTREERKAASEQRKREHDRRIADAARLWNEAQYPRDTIAENYLASRKLRLPFELCDRALRFHPACPFEGETVPCLIAAFRSITSDNVTGIHRIRLDQSERWPKAQRMMLGIIAGSAVKLDALAGNSLVIGEGIETCMAARQLGLGPVWALGSAGGIENFAPIAGVDQLVILGENDNGTNQKAAETCRQKWKDRRVTIIKPPRGQKDMNDILMEGNDAKTSTRTAVERC
jgi:putative DNA primase/helicase